MTTSTLRQVVELKYKTASELREIYNNLFPDSSANSNAGKEHLIHKIAYRIQELAFGGLDDTTKAALEIAAKGKSIFTKSGHSDLLPGTKIHREYDGIMYEVEVLNDGFEYNGKKWKSLSAIATKITGTKWNGPRFFGLRG
jgi:hypothetical protein